MSGRGTAGGVVFQAEIGAAVAGLILAERDLARLGSGLPGLPQRVLFETPTAVDDVIIETDVGEVYVQAKRTISLSSKDDSGLASVVDQFVRQFRSGINENGSRRDLDPARDRLLLSVSDNTVATVANHLKEALDRHRTGAATAMPRNLLNALKVFSRQIDAAWKKVAGVAISVPERNAVLRMCSVALFADGQRQLAVEALRDVVAKPGNEKTVFELLENWAAAACKSGVGGDAGAIRLALAGKADLSESPSYAADVKKLLAYSADVRERLRRFTEIPAPEGNVSIDRPVAEVVAAATRYGSLVITGDPGAGKSAVLHQVAKRLSKAGPVIAFSVEAGATSLDALRAEIDLQHSLLGVLKQLPGNRPAYLVLDALDAVRGGPAEATYKRLVEEVSRIPGWHVVASVRSFDLRLGREWRRLFPGNAYTRAHSDATLPGVHHVHISLLDEGEKADLASKSPTLASAVEAGGAKMDALSRNPFNLALLADLLRGGVEASSLTTVATRGELLERYWQERVLDLGLAATTSLKSVVDQMVANRTIDLAETKVLVPAAQMVDELQRAGVLVTASNHRIGFRHHVLFDYAVARLLLFADVSEAFEHVKKDLGAGLLISPSLGYWLEHLRKQTSALDYWNTIARLVTDSSIDPIVRVEVARLAVEAAVDEAGLRDLATVLTSPDASLGKAFGHLVGALLTKLVSKEPFSVEPWAKLLGMMTSPKEDQLGSMRALIGVALDANPSTEACNNLGVAARTIFDATTTNPNLIGWLSPHIVPYIARTYATDLAASRARLEMVINGERFDRFGYVEVPWLAQHVADIAPHDLDFVVQVYARVFRGGEFSRDQKTSMSGSWILSLTSNAAQDFGMATHSLSTAFPKILSSHPTLGLRALAVTLRGEQEKNHPLIEQQEAKSFPVAGTQFDFFADRSSVWGWNADDDRHDDYAKIFRAYLDWLPEADPQDLVAAPELVLSETGIGIAWRAVFEAGARRPEVLGAKLWEAATSELALKCEDTRQSAINLMAAASKNLDKDKLSEAEDRWLSLQFEDYTNPERARVSLLGKVFDAIGLDTLQTEAARNLLISAKEQGLTFNNDKPFQIHTTWRPRGHWLEHEGVDIKAPAVARLVNLSTRVKDALKKAEDSKRARANVTVWNATAKLWKAIDAPGAAIDAHVDQEASDALAEGLEHSIRTGAVPEDERDAAIQRLLKITEHPDPETSREIEEQFARSPSWGSPSPRIQAAQAMTSLVRFNGMWSVLRERMERLVVDDPHPAVRFHLVRAIPSIMHYSADAAWSLVERIAEKETNASIIHQLGHCLYHLRGKDDERIERIVLDIAERHPQGDGHEDAITEAIIYFAIERELPASMVKLAAWVDKYQEQEERLLVVVFDLRSRSLRGFDGGNVNDIAVRHRARAFIEVLIAKIEPAVRAWPLRGGDPTAEEKSAFKIFSSIADQLYYGIGHGEKLPPWLEPSDVQRAFLSETANLITKLTTLGSPAAVHHLMELVGKLVAANPELCFELFSEAMLRTTGVAKYEYESMGADRFVDLVGRYLADYRYLFDDETRRRKLIDCMAIFVEAGWPSARRLFQNLPDLLK
ncbi:hypothetical protein [Bradyrhizobium sp. URHD0069]|uniref:hypothetical protein n=1 Tax=Bradyrhizobium sp. URHD0069 TaxID=1380355 RepID=UPI0004952A36|nr:hypothetical protein [Bradyrhizobium sp. URHD0069]